MPPYHSPYAAPDLRAAALADAIARAEKAEAERDAALADVERLRAEVGSLIRSRAGLRPLSRFPLP